MQNTKYPWSSVRVSTPFHYVAVFAMLSVYVQVCNCLVKAVICWIVIIAYLYSETSDIPKEGKPPNKGQIQKYSRIIHSI